MDHKNINKNQDYSTIKKLVGGKAKRVVIVIHHNPDGDAIGSSLALQKLLVNAGHSCSIISPNAYPPFLAWMPGSENIYVYHKDEKNVSEIIQRADILFALDFNDLSRIEKFNDSFDKSSGYKLLIDHHPDPSEFADFILSDTSVSSTAELLFRFIGEAGFEKFMDKDVASCLFTGILTDTGCFSYNSSRRETYEIVAALINYKIDKDEIYAKVYDNFSADRMRLMGYCLHEKMEIVAEFNAAFIWLTKDELKKFNFKTGDTEDFVNLPLSIKGIRFSAFFIEKNDRVKISFRSKGSFPVNEFARKHFNGGGHMNASGGDSFTTLEDALKNFSDLLPLYKDALTSTDE